MRFKKSQKHRDDESIKNIGDIEYLEYLILDMKARTANDGIMNYDIVKADTLYDFVQGAFRKTIRFMAQSTLFRDPKLRVLFSCSVSNIDLMIEQYIDFRYPNKLSADKTMLFWQVKGLYINSRTQNVKEADFGSFDTPVSYVHIDGVKVKLMSEAEEPDNTARLVFLADSVNGKQYYVISRFINVPSKNPLEGVEV